MAFSNHPGNKFHEIMFSVFARFCLPAVFSLLSEGHFDFMNFVTRTAFRNPPGNKFHEVKFVLLFVFSVLSKRQLDFMKFVTRMSFPNHPGNKFHEITSAVFPRFCLLVGVLVAFERPL